MTTNLQFNLSPTLYSPLVSPLTLPHYPTERLIDHRSAVCRYLEGAITMKRIAIIGSSGSGKSTLARQLGAELHLPVIHLDKHYWHPGWIGTPEAEWTARVEEMVQGERWIIDGNYRSTLNMRLQAADTVIFLDMPRWLCAIRAVKRRLQYMNRPRPDMAEGCRERLLDPNLPRFLHWVWDYPNRARPDVTQRLHDLDPDKRIIWLKTPAHVRRFLLDPHGASASLMSPDELERHYARRNMCDA